MEAESSEQVAKHVCPVTGIPYSSRTHWDMVQLGKELWVTFETLGEHILLTTFYGKESVETTQRFLDEHTRVLREMNAKAFDFYEIRDYANVTSWPHEKSDSHAINRYVGQWKYIKELLVASTPEYVRSQYIHAEKTMNTCGTQLTICDDYTEAILNIFTHEPDVFPLSESLCWKSSSLWQQCYRDFCFKLEKLEENILLITGQGLLDKQNLTILLAAQHLFLHKNPMNNYYRVVGVDGVKMESWRTARDYFDGVVRLNKKYIPVASYIYGVPSVYRVIAKMVQVLYPFHLMLFRDYESCILEIEKNLGLVVKRSEVGGYQVMHTEKDVERFANELLKVIGDIRMDVYGSGEFPKILSTHPFYTVFESLQLVKKEVDRVLWEYRDALKKVDEEAKDGLLAYESIVGQCPDTAKDSIIVLRNALQNMVQICSELNKKQGSVL
jgi:hypothetical protein